MRWISLVALAFALGCSGSTAGSGSSNSTTGTAATGSGTTGSSGSHASSSSSSSASSGTSSSSSASSSASSSGSTDVTSSSSSSTGTTTNDSGSSTGSTTGSDSGSTGSTGDDAGPPDAGLPVYTFDAGPNVYWCHAFDQGVFTTYSQTDAGCITDLPACVGQSIPLDPEVHVPEPMLVDYRWEPEPAGPHWPCWASWSLSHAYSKLPTERWLHNSEHGGVIMLYRCDTDAGLPDGGSCDAMVDPLIAFVTDGGPSNPEGDRRYLVVARPELPTNYALVAWGWSLLMDTWDPTQADCFATAHLSAGPEDLMAGPDSPDIGACPQSWAP